MGDLPLNSHAAWKDLQDILLSKKKVAFKCIEDDIIYDKIYTRKTTELCAVMKETKLTHFVTLSDGLALDAPKLGGNDMGKNKELQSTKTRSRYTKYTIYTKEEITIYITNCILMFWFWFSTLLYTYYIFSFLRLLNILMYLFSRYLAKVF